MHHHVGHLPAKRRTHTGGELFAHLHDPSRREGRAHGRVGPRETAAVAAADK